mmetsp:Transcript_103596/g.322840  ORF Transcript_103596/g.322840 Transcript_103596/m.322840 type:complete len:221 (+) Transcript_103596:631-1293(+)
MRQAALPHPGGRDLRGHSGGALRREAAPETRLRLRRGHHLVCGAVLDDHPVLRRAQARHLRRVQALHQLPDRQLPEGADPFEQGGPHVHAAAHARARGPDVGAGQDHGNTGGGPRLRGLLLGRALGGARAGELVRKGEGRPLLPDPAPPPQRHHLEDQRPQPSGPPREVPRPLAGAPPEFHALHVGPGAAVGGAVAEVAVCVLGGLAEARRALGGLPRDG